MNPVRSLARAIPYEVASPMDDYYRGIKFMEAEAAKGNVLNWDQPEAVDVDLLLSHLQTLKRGYGIRKPKYNFKTGEVEGSEQFGPAKVIILEGLLALNDTLAPVGDIKVFVDVGFHGRILRRLFRDVKRTGQRPIDILRQCVETVEPMYEKYVQGTKANADLIILNEYDPDIEAKKCGGNEAQLKFRTKFIGEDLIKLGAERLGMVVQRDHYYNPKDRDLRTTGEILRVREEAGLTLLTYKGPKVDSTFRERPKFEFEIDPEAKKMFLRLYGDEVKMIVKTRQVYQLDGVVLSLDDDVNIVVGIRGRNMGKFIEIRFGDDDSTDKVLAKLGLMLAQGIKESYYEM